MDEYPTSWADWDSDLQDAHGGGDVPYQRNWAHGLSGYQAGCRCEVCVTERRNYNREYMRQWRARRRKEAVTAGG